MKNFLLPVFSAFYYPVFFAGNLPKIINDKLYTAGGYKITAGQQLKLGTGTKDNGDLDI